ncbi:ppiA [Symbiodinium pilosum]|uniref:PpiA protein n=1 Tax=Symbiodinium pilosum TaxID=2952 RepID=A0A812MB57_SYMPI|nr:ppiA [Symbiodinium pilosum]
MKLAKIVAASLVCKLEAVAIEGKTKEVLPDPNQVSLPSVPGVVDAGTNGFPELPTVSTMLSDSAQTLNGISSQAQRLQAQMLTVQQENAARMQRQKAVFDRKLKEQEQKNLDVVKENALIAKTIMETKKANEDLLRHAQSLQKGNSLRHNELKLLQDQLAAAQKFLTESVEQTDDSKAKELDVLAEEKATSKSLSLLALSSTSETEPAEKIEAKAGETGEAESLLTMLGSGIKALKKQGQESEAKLKSLFLADFQAGVRRHKALLNQQKVLKETLETMKTYHARLESADKHLQATQTTMDGRLHDGGMFMQKLSELTMAHPEDPRHFVQMRSSVKAKADNVLLAFCNTNTASHHITSTLTHGPLKSLNPEMQDFPLRSYHRILGSRNRLWNSKDYDSCALRWQSDPHSHGQSHLAWASAFQQNAVEVFSCALMQQCHFMQLHDCASKAKFLAALAAMHLAANIVPGGHIWRSACPDVIQRVEARAWSSATFLALAREMQPKVGRGSKSLPAMLQSACLWMPSAYASVSGAVTAASAALDHSMRRAESFNAWTPAPPADVELAEAQLAEIQQAEALPIEALPPNVAGPAEGPLPSSKFGFYLHVYADPAAVIHQVRQVKHHFPDSPIYVMSDGGMDFSSLCKQEKCTFTLCPPANDRWHPWPFFRRIYDAALSLNTEYLIMLEPDNTVHSPVRRLPQHDVGGVHVPNRAFQLAEHVEKLAQERVPGFRWSAESMQAGLCGGAYFRTEAVLDAFSDENVMQIDWNLLGERVDKEIFSSDFAMQYALAARGWRVGIWEEVAQMDKDKDVPLAGPADAAFRHYCSCYPGGKPTYNLQLRKEDEDLFSPAPQEYTVPNSNCQLCYNLDRYVENWGSAKCTNRLGFTYSQKLMDTYHPELKSKPCDLPFLCKPDGPVGRS